MGSLATVVLVVAGCSGPGPTTVATPAATTPAPTSTVAATSTTVRPLPTTRPRSTTTSTTVRAAPPRPTTTVPATGSRVLPLGTYTDWLWPAPAPAASYTAQVLNLTVLSDPGPSTPYFFAHQFGFDKGVGGYVGLQTRGRISNDPDAPMGRIALFSMFAGCDDRAGTAGCPKPLPLIGASAQPGLLNGSSCWPLTTPSGSAAEGPGATCRVPFEWREGVTYGLQVVQSAPHQWEARVIDGATGGVTVIGRIGVPETWGGLSTFSVSWIEYYGDTRSLPGCGAIPVARVRWDGAAGSQSTRGGLLGLGTTTIAVQPPSLHNHLAVGPGLCPNSSITDVAPVGRAVVQVVGAAP